MLSLTLLNHLTNGLAFYLTYLIMGEKKSNNDSTGSYFPPYLQLETKFTATSIQYLDLHNKITENLSLRGPWELAVLRLHCPLLFNRYGNRNPDTGGIAQSVRRPSTRPPCPDSRARLHSAMSRLNVNCLLKPTRRKNAEWNPMLAKCNYREERLHVL